MTASRCRLPAGILIVLLIGLAGCGGGGSASIGRDVTPLPPDAAPMGAMVPNGVQISWSASPTGGVTSYRVYRRDSAGNRTLVGETNDQVRTFTDNSPLQGTSAYTVTAVKAIVESPESDQLIWGT